MRSLSLVLATIAMLVAQPSLAHEFWLSPQSYRVAAGGQVVADIRVGQNFNGSVYSYIPQRFVRFDLVQGDSVVAVGGRMGDLPALTMAAPADGLVRVVHQTTNSYLTYKDADKFVYFVTHKDLPGVLAAHAARGLPAVGFRERYSRYAKALIAVGDGAGRDAAVGMETEIVALANPYTDDLSAGMPVRVLYQGAPRVDVRVQVFARQPDGEVLLTNYRTDAKGEVTIPVSAGVEYLVDAVVMRPLQPIAANDPVWESLWASLTFKP